MSGIAFPYFTPSSMLTNSPSRWYVRIRRDDPDIQDGKEKRKYVAPYADRKHLYFPPRPQRFADTTVPILLVEAEKSETSTGERVPEHGALPDLNICRDGRKTFVCLDSNTNSNSQVQAGRAALITQLRKQNADVAIIDLPDSPGVNGPDDFVGFHGDAAMGKLIDSTEPVRPDDDTRPLEEKLREMNERYCYVDESDIVVRLSNMRMFDSRQFKEGGHLANKFHTTTMQRFDPQTGEATPSVRKEKLAKLWLEWPDMRQVERIVSSQGNRNSLATASIGGGVWV